VYRPLDKIQCNIKKFCQNETRDILTPSCYVLEEFLRIIDFCFCLSERSEAFASKKQNQESSLRHAPFRMPKTLLMDPLKKEKG